jgi:hypothetical protein
MMSFYLSRIQARRVNAEEMLGLLVSTQTIELVIALAGRSRALLLPRIDSMRIAIAFSMQKKYLRLFIWYKNVTIFS